MSRSELLCLTGLMFTLILAAASLVHWYMRRHKWATWLVAMSFVVAIATWWQFDPRLPAGKIMFVFVLILGVAALIAIMSYCIDEVSAHSQAKDLS